MVWSQCRVNREAAGQPSPERASFNGGEPRHVQSMMPAQTAVLLRISIVLECHFFSISVLEVVKLF